MLNALAGKLYVNVLAFSMLLFSAYTGNDAVFTAFSAKTTGDNIVFQAFLKDAFTNDFEEIFKSGKPIRIWFEIRVVKGDKLLHFEKFYHQVVWNAADNQYAVDLQEQDFKTKTKDPTEMKSLISVIQYPFYKQKVSGNLNVEIVSYLPKIYLDSIDKEVDLMLLWKMKKPKIKKEFRI